MTSNHRPETGPRATNDVVRARLAWGAAAAVALSGLVVATGWATDTRLGAPLYWPWLLTGLQVLALWSAGTGRWWGWLLGGSVQLPWIAYALVTGQIGFIPGCAVSAAVQSYSFARRHSPPGGIRSTLPVVETATGSPQEATT